MLAVWIRVQLSLNFQRGQFCSRGLLTQDVGKIGELRSSLSRGAKIWKAWIVLNPPLTSSSITGWTWSGINDSPPSVRGTFLMNTICLGRPVSMSSEKWAQRIHHSPTDGSNSQARSLGSPSKSLLKQPLTGICKAGALKRGNTKRYSYLFR